MNRRIHADQIHLGSPAGGWYVPLAIARRAFPMPIATSIDAMAVLLHYGGDRSDTGVALLPGELFGQRLHAEPVHIIGELVQLGTVDAGIDQDQSTIPAYHDGIAPDPRALPDPDAVGHLVQHRSTLSAIVHACRVDPLPDGLPMAVEGPARGCGRRRDSDRFDVCDG